MPTDPKPIPFVAASLVPLYHDAAVSVNGQAGRLSAGCRPVDGRLLVIFRSGAGGTFPVSDVRFLLDNPLAMCHAARWLATRLGMEPGPTAPLWSFADGVWLLQTETMTAVFHSGTYLVDDPDTIGRYVECLPMSKNKYAEALAAACVAVGGA